MQQVNTNNTHFRDCQTTVQGKVPLEDTTPQIGEGHQSLAYWLDDFVTTKLWGWLPATLRAYTSVLNLYADYVGHDHWPLTRLGELRWLAKVRETSSQATVHSYWIHLKSFLNYLEKVDAIPFSQNPARQILELGVAPEKPDLLPVAFPPEDLDQLFRYLENAAQSGDREAIRDVALLRFAYVTACRCGEIARLTLDYLDLEGHTAVILAETSKSKRLRTVCFDDDVSGTVRNWLAVRPSVKGVREVVVSLGGRLGYGQPMKPQALYAILQRQSDAAKISRVANSMRCATRVPWTPWKKA